MNITFLQQNKLTKKIIYNIGRKRAQRMINRIEHFLDKKDKILDLGCGTCNVSELLTQKHYNVTPLDVKNLSFVQNLQPQIYDGNKIPYGENNFDKAIILTVLHHTPNPEKILKYKEIPEST